MKLNKVKWIYMILFVFGVGVLCAQTSLNVKEKLGTNTSYMLNELKRLTFTPGVMTVTKKNGNYGVFILTNMRNVNFTTVTSVEEINSSEERNLSFYPNPVMNLLHIQFKSNADENVLLQLIDIQGKIVLQQYVKSILGSNHIEIPVGSFKDGLYLCRLQTGSKIESNKFIKY